MHKYLSEGTDGFDDRQECMLVREMSEELDELWEKISTKEIKENQKLTKLFDEFQEHLGFLKSEMQGEAYDGIDYDEEEDIQKMRT
jgi:predicted transcriptional regulator